MKEQTMTSTKRVLVVDDDPIVGQCFDQVLAPKGYAVIRASSGDEALARLASEQYDVVYTDIKMPGMSGIEVARRVRATSPWLPVVIVTGYGSQQNHAEAAEIGVTDFLAKPLSPEVIGQSADAILGEAPAPLASPAAPVSVQPPPLPTETPAQGNRILKRAGNIALFFLAPFIGLAYIVIGPLVGLGILAWMGVKSLVSRVGS
jgi:CheY-like chemotaxis protein